jgi:hypothetical protein
MWNLTSFHLETVLVSVQDRCTVCDKHTISSEIILDAPDGTLRWRGSSESSVRSEIVLILTQDRCSICVEHSIGSKIILDARNGTPRWRRSWEPLFFLFGDSVSVDTRWVHSLCQMYHWLRNHFGCTRWYPLVTRPKWKLGPFRNSANLDAR